jgi:MoaA/NifB/PqqE/SkfB family radical SAM enzyme
MATRARPSGADPRAPVKNCEIILNYDCNARCVFCYQPEDDLKPCSEKRMPFSAASKALYQGYARGCRCAYFIGGEITLLPDLPKIIKLAAKIGYPWIQVMSNGLRLAEKAYTDDLIAAGANLFRLSLHGPSEKIHDRLVGVPGAFARLTAAFDNIKSGGAELCVNMALNKVNYRSLPEMVKLVTGRFGVRDFNIIFPHYSGMMAKNSGLLKVSVGQAVPYLRRTLAYMKKAGVRPESRVLINFCPCNIPEAAHLMAEWDRPSRPEDDEPLYYVEGQTDAVYSVKERIRVKNPSCSRCVYDPVCMGFEKWYADVFGRREFRPVLKKPEPFPLFPLPRRKPAREGGR